MKKLKNILLLAAVVLLSTSMWAQGDIITAKEFKQLIKSNSDLVILEVSKPEAFKKSHVKNAINLHHNDLVVESEDIPGMIFSIEKLAEIFGSKGISETSEIVVYDGGTQKYSSRVYWALLYAGATNVKMVHKEMGQWGKARIPLTSQVTERAPVTFTPTLNPDLNVDMDYVAGKAGQPNVVLIDTRHHDEYVGEGEEAYDSDGHIPGAIHMEYKNLMEENGAFKSAEALKAELEKIGFSPEKEYIFYCNTGILGTVGYVATKNILGYDNVKVYDGSIYEWEVNYELEK